MGFDIFDESRTILRNRIIQNNFLLTVFSHHLVFEIPVAVYVGWTGRDAWTLFLKFLRMTHLLSWLKAVVVNVYSKIFTLSVCVNHKLNCWNFNLILGLTLLNLLLVVLLRIHLCFLVNTTSSFLLLLHVHDQVCLPILWGWIRLSPRLWYL